VRAGLPLPEILAAFEATYGQGMFVSNGNQRTTEAFTAPPARS